MLTCSEMQALEDSVFATGVTPDGLMEKVGRRMAQLLLADHSEPGRAVAYLGKGHNAGDALVVLRYLQEQGWSVNVRLAFPEDELAPLTRQKLSLVLCEDQEPLVGRRPLLLLDGLLGIGGQGDLREPLFSLAQAMNELRLTRGARTIAMDLPSGLNADTGEGGCVVADQTLTVGVPKVGLVADSASDFVGRLTLVHVEELPLPKKGGGLITRENLRPFFPPRAASFHKGQAGRLAIIAGSLGLVGAAVLASKAALRAGAGLITLWVEVEILPIVQGLIPPEIMVRERGSVWSEIFELRPDALVIGPGLGKKCADSLLALLAENVLPTVLDADALNLIAAHERQDLLKRNVIVTPHPGEMKRLHSGEGSRSERARNFSCTYEATLLLKGARTIVTSENEGFLYNTTGTPGMATGGQGDVLSGVIGAFLAGGMPLVPAASAGAWLTGRAAELAQVDERSLTPGDVIDSLGAVMQDLWL